jgi:hypothetical protein
LVASVAPRSGIASPSADDQSMLHLNMSRRLLSEYSLSTCPCSGRYVGGGSAQRQSAEHSLAPHANSCTKLRTGQNPSAEDGGKGGRRPGGATARLAGMEEMGPRSAAAGWWRRQRRSRDGRRRRMGMADPNPRKRWFLRDAKEVR